MRIQNSVVLITGASEGIGAACAAAFARRGARLSLVSRSQEKLEALGLADAELTAADLLESGARQLAVERTLARFGRIDVLINNAGVGMYAPAHAAPIEDVRRMFELNFFAPLELAQLAAAQMKTQPVTDGARGTIVNVGSIAGKVVLPWLTLYSTTKFALGALTEGLRMELQPHQIRAMLVCPGYVKTRFQAHALAGQPPAAIAGGKRFAIPVDECAEAVVRGVERNARTVLAPRLGWALVAMERMFPSLVHSQLARINSKMDAAKDAA
ncbi:MAG: SDR family NAD(P)-dependent oxidoreductase [Bryobacteraceae bacterium]